MASRSIIQPDVNQLLASKQTRSNQRKWLLNQIGTAIFALLALFFGFGFIISLQHHGLTENGFIFGVLMAATFSIVVYQRISEADPVGEDQLATPQQRRTFIEMSPDRAAVAEVLTDCDRMGVSTLAELNIQLRSLLSKKS